MIVFVFTRTCGVIDSCVCQYICCTCRKQLKNHLYFLKQSSIMQIQGKVFWLDGISTSEIKPCIKFKIPCRLNYRSEVPQYFNYRKVPSCLESIKKMGALVDYIFNASKTVSVQVLKLAELLSCCSRLPFLQSYQQTIISFQDSTRSPCNEVQYDGHRSKPFASLLHCRNTRLCLSLILHHEHS